MSLIFNVRASSSLLRSLRLPESVLACEIDSASTTSRTWPATGCRPGGVLSGEILTFHSCARSCTSRSTASAAGLRIHHVPTRNDERRVCLEVLAAPNVEFRITSLSLESLRWRVTVAIPCILRLWQLFSPTRGNRYTFLPCRPFEGREALRMMGRSEQFFVLLLDMTGQVWLELLCPSPSAFQSYSALFFVFTKN